MHLALREFKQRFINFSAHFGYTHQHPFPIEGDAVGDLPPADAVAGGGGPVPPLPPQAVPGPPDAADPAPPNPMVPILDGDDASITDSSSSDVSSLACVVVDSDSSDGVHSVTVIN